jgi:hypothetical protein
VRARAAQTLDDAIDPERLKELAREIEEPADDDARDAQLAWDLAEALADEDVVRAVKRRLRGP